MAIHLNSTGDQLCSRSLYSDGFNGNKRFRQRNVNESRLSHLFKLSCFALLLFLVFFIPNVQANVSIASSSQSPSNPIIEGGNVQYNLVIASDLIGASQVDIFINIDGQNRTSDFTSQLPGCTFDQGFFNCGSLSPSFTFNASFSRTTDAIGTENVQIQVFCLHTNESPCSGATTSFTTEIVTPTIGTIGVANSSISVDEGAGTVSIQVDRFDGDIGAASVQYQTVAGTASANSDFSPESGTLTWVDGDDSPKTVTVNVSDDLDLESDETFTLELSNVSGASLGQQTETQVTIVDNDFNPGTISFENAAQTIDEGSPISIAVTRSGGDNGTASVTFTTSDDTATGGGVDYQSINGTLTWGDGEAGTKTISLETIGDAFSEGSEQFSVILDDPQGASLGQNSELIVSIQDNASGVVEFENVGYSIDEGAGTADITVTRTGGSGTTSVTVVQSGGSAEQDTDYQYSTSTVTWIDGETGSKSVEVTLVDDSINENNETVSFELSNLTGDQLGDTVSTVLTIVDNDDGSTEPETPSNPIEDALKDIAKGDPGRSSVAEVIAKICPLGVVGSQLQSDCNDLVGAALSDDDTSKAAAAIVLEQITSDDASAAATVAGTGGEAQLRNLLSRLSALRRGSSGLDLTGLNLNLQGTRLTVAHMPNELRSMLENGGAAGDEADRGLLSDNKIGIFVGGTVSVGDKDATDNEEGFDFKTQGITLGVDYRLTDKVILGGAIGYNNIDTDIASNGGSLDSDSLSLSIYGTSYQTDQFFIEGIISFSQNDFDQERTVLYQYVDSDVISQKATASYDGDQLSIAIGGGYHFVKGAMTLTPTARIEYVDTSIDSFNEKMSNPSVDGGGWALSLDDQSLDSMTLTLGLDATYAMSQSWGVMVPQASIEWVNEFEDGSRLISGHFVGDPTQEKFVLPTDEFDSSYFNVRIGVSGQFQNGSSGYIYYQRLIGYDDLESNSIGLGFRWTF